MSRLGIIIKNEYLTDIRTRSFWVSTVVVPVLFILFVAFVGYMLAGSGQSELLVESVSSTEDDPELSRSIGMLTGIFLAMFLMIYGTMIYSKVKREKVNRIIEIMATCVTGRTMMLGKIISVGLIGLTQIAVWVSMAGLGLYSVTEMFDPGLSLHDLFDFSLWKCLAWAILFFIAGYVFYGSMYAACGAITDKDNENQGYMTVITFLLLGSFYVGQFAALHPDSAFVIFCSYFPFTAPAVATVNAVAGTVPLWQSILSLLTLAVFAYISVTVSGKIYISSLLLKGKRFKPSDIILFLKSK